MKTAGTELTEQELETYEKEDGFPIREISDQYQCGHWTNWQISYDKGKTWCPAGFCRKC